MDKEFALEHSRNYITEQRKCSNARKLTISEPLLKTHSEGFNVQTVAVHIPNPS